MKNALRSALVILASVFALSVYVGAAMLLASAVARLVGGGWWYFYLIGVPVCWGFLDWASLKFLGWFSAGPPEQSVLYGERSRLYPLDYPSAEVFSTLFTWVVSRAPFNERDLEEREASPRQVEEM